MTHPTFLPSNPKIRAQIMSVGTYLPDEVVTSDSIMQEIHSDTNYGMPCNWMSKEMGIIERRMAPDSFKPSDLAIRAAQQAIDVCDQIKPDDIQAVIFCGIERDQPEPATAHTIQNALGLKAHHVFDIANACFGFVDGIKLANAMIATEMINNALVVTGEVSTKVLRAVVEMMKSGVPKAQVQSMLGALTVGDAGGALLLGRATNSVSGFVGFNQRCDSRQVDRCRYKFGTDGVLEGQMQMAQIVARGFQLNKGMFEESLKMFGWSDIDWVLTHQTGKRTFQQVLTLKSVNRAKLVKTYPKLANITTATLPLSLKKLLESGKMRRGDRMGGLFAGSGLVSGQFGYVV